MGQQQLLLLVLGIVIVGLAVVVGIQAFGENQKKANADAMTNDAIRIASDAQAWVLKPKAFGGGNGDFNGTGNVVTLAKLGYTTLATATTTPFTCAVGDYSNLNGCYSLAAATGGTANAGTNGSKITITGSNSTRGNGVKTVVCGTGPNNIATAVGAVAVAAPSCPS